MSKMPLDPTTLEYLYTLAQVTNIDADWKTALDKFLVELRRGFVFDNVAIYMVDPDTLSLEIAYARAVGRGKAAEADAAWGEELANQILTQEKMIMQKPVDGSDDRLSQAHLLGLPLYGSTGKISGAMVFIRFGGPVFEEGQIAMAQTASIWVTTILNRRVHLETQKQLDTIQQRLQFQDDFVATISHELRTPLGFIKGYSTTLLRADTSWDDETKQEFLMIIDEETDRLSQLIDNILESAKLQSRSVQLNMEPLRLDALIRDSVIRARKRHKELNVELQIETVDPILGDSVRLIQVLDNLFSNATKYAADTKIEIAVKCEEENVLISFTDHGPGIPKIYLPHIFERFYRVPGENSSAGSGLGLYICNQIVTAHHGKIWVESIVDQGTTFYIQLPFK